jgi:hypothetical protein
MSKNIFIIIFIFFVSNVCVSQVIIGDTSKSDPILKPVLHSKKSHTLKKKKSAIQPVVKSEPKKSQNKPTKKVDKAPATKVNVVKATPAIKKTENKPEKKAVVATKTATFANVVLPESSVPIFKGGKKAMDNFIKQNLIFPNNADKNGIKGVIEFS